MNRIALRDDAPTDGFPFNLTVIKQLGQLELKHPVTILVGDNGSGKSTLLESLAYATERITAGSSSLERDSTLEHVKMLGDALRLSWTTKTARGFFLRAEDFFGYVKAQNAMKTELAKDLARTRRENEQLSPQELARISAPFTGSLAATEARYGKNLDANSHGESFLAFFKARINGAGFYLLDEPEAALSPLSQLAFLTLLKDAVAAGAQLIIATHAPVLMAYPEADLLEIREGRLTRTAFAELEHVKLLRDFLAAPEVFLRHL